MEKYPTMQHGLLLHLFCWLLIYCCLFILPASSKAQQQPGFFAENYFVGQTLGDGKDGRIDYTWKKKVGERPINKVVLKVRKQGDSVNSSISVSFDDGHTLGNIRPQAVNSKELTTIEWEGKNEAPNSRYLVIAASDGHIFLESVIIDTVSTWEGKRPSNNYHKEEEEILDIYKRVKEDSALEEKKYNEREKNKDPLFGEKRPW
ncbi:MAG: hypothetical protein IT292_01120 [Deltaproteobacteria bacterium]|nr:hypothetical protein [Deltaproteobacteria bacterium]